MRSARRLTWKSAAFAALSVFAFSGALRAQAWSLDSAVAPTLVNDASQLLNASFVPMPGGQFLVYGDFTHVNGASAPGLARLGADGKLDPTFAPDLAADERISSIAPLADGRAVAIIGAAVQVTAATASATYTVTTIDSSVIGVVGSAATGSGAVAPAGFAAKLMRLRADGRKDLTFSTIALDGYAQLTTAPDGHVLVWGSFSTIAGQGSGGIARLNSNGTLDTTFRPILFFPHTSFTGTGIIPPPGPTTIDPNPTLPRTVGASLINSLAVAQDGTIAMSVSGLYSLSAIPETDHSRASGLITLLPSGKIGFSVNTGMDYSLLAVQPDGSVIAGNTTFSFAEAVAVGAPDIPVPIGATGGLVRYTPAGTLDRTYSPQISGLKRITRILPLSDGRLAVEATLAPANIFYGAPAVFTFGANGQLLTDWRKVPGAREGQRLLAAQSDGRLLLAQGTLVVTSSFYPVPYDATAPAVATIRPIFLGPTLVDPALAISPPDASAAPTTPLTALPTTLVYRSSGHVTRLETDSAGRVLAAGSFTHIDGQPRAGLARFLAGGALDATFLPPAGELLFVPADGRAIVRRTTLGPADATDGFHRYGTQIVRLQHDGSADPAFSFPSTLDAAKTNWLLTAPDGRLLVAAFDPDDAKEENLKLIWLGADGRRLSTLPTVFTGFKRALILPAELSGTANPFDVVAVPTIYPGGNDRPNVIDSAQMLANGRLLVAGAFSKVNGTARTALARLNADGSLDATDAPDTTALNYFYSALPLADGRVLAFGSSLSSGRWQPRVVRFRPDGSLDPTFQPPADTIGPGTRVFADGSFSYYGRRFAADGWPDLNFAPRLRYASGAGYAYAAALGTAGHLWLGGWFDQVNGQTRHGLARFAPAEVVGLTVPPASQKVVAGRDAFFQVALGTTQPATFRWTHDGATIAGATNANLRLPAVRGTDVGVYRVLVTLGPQTFTSDAATLAVVPGTSRLTNFSARSVVSPTTPPQVAGVVTAGVTPRTVLLRAVGRGLPGGIGIPLLPSPVLTLYENGRLMSENRGGAMAPAVTTLASSVGAFPLGSSPTTPAGALLDSALTPVFGNGNYTAVTTSGDGGTGLSLFEFYDTLTEGAPALVRNLAIRGTTSPGAGVLTGGFVIAGNSPLQVLVRGIGPSLAAFGLSGTVSDPRLDVFSGSAGTALASNSGWANDADLAAAARRVGAFALPAASRDTAVLLTLEPGAYTAQLSSTSGASGAAMIEVYIVEN
jgi:uncharacterized delta-60 repeat protein